METGRMPVLRIFVLVNTKVADSNSGRRKTGRARVRSLPGCPYRNPGRRLRIRIRSNKGRARLKTFSDQRRRYFSAGQKMVLAAGPGACDGRVASAGRF